ncbi:MAG: serine/threonine-protein phosphatase [Gammaproteobacteria bacterium]|nr:serine/threonine-protein phosphatase [Gammaproteobacteria bacterium]
MSPKLSWSSSAKTHVGRVRKINEDCLLDMPAQGLWAVADGMGGLSAGDVASQHLVAKLGQFKTTNTLTNSINQIESLILEANQDLKRMGEELGKGKSMGTTVAALFTDGDHAIILWAGDSRIYRYRDGELLRLSEDHSFVEELVRIGVLSPEQAENHPASNIVSRAVGVEDKLLVDVEYFKAMPSDIYILCSDGLFKELSEDNIKSQIINDLPECCANLVAAAVTAGGGDNISVIAVKVE